MRRREAVGLFREICECIPDPSGFSSVFLIQTSQADSLEENFELRINAMFDGRTLETIKVLLKKRRMFLVENKGSLVIYAPAQKRIQMGIVA